MRSLHILDAYRVDDDTIAGERHGVFSVPSCSGRGKLAVIAASEMGWDQIDVTRDDRYPDWLEMEQIALLFFKDDEAAMIVHQPSQGHAKPAAFTLRWLRPHSGLIPQPGGTALVEKEFPSVGAAAFGG
jgi:hypothetical protein